MLKRASASRPSGDWNDDAFDVRADGAVVGRIFKVHAAPVGTPWMWTLAFGHHEDRTPTHGLLMTCVRAIARLPRAATENAWKAKGNSLRASLTRHRDPTAWLGM